MVKNLVNQCKCHGLSGSCQLKTCWKSSPNFRLVGKILKQQFRHAVLVDQSNLGSGISIVPTKEAKRRRQSKSAANRNQKLKQQRRPSYAKIKNIDEMFAQQPWQRPNQQQPRNRKRNSPNNNNNGRGGRMGRSRIDNSLFFYQKSPNFCDKDLKSDIPGTQGRRCKQHDFGSESCATLCCNRGYFLVREVSFCTFVVCRSDANIMSLFKLQQVTQYRCQCRFHWCCEVECQTCEKIEYISVCK